MDHCWLDDSLVRLSCAILPSMVLSGCIMLYCQAPKFSAQYANLLQQAQAGLMSGLNSQQRHEMYTKISDDSLAGMLVVMRFPERLKMLREVEQVDQALVDRVLRYIR